MTPRIPPIAEGEKAQDFEEILDIFAPPEARDLAARSNVLRTFAQHPPLAKAFLAYNRYLFGSTLTKRQREIPILRVSWRYQCDYEWSSHAEMARRYGMTPEEIEAIKVGPDAPNWAPEEAALLSAVDELTEHGRVGDATWDVLAAHMSREQIMDLLFTIGTYAQVGWVINAMQVEVEDPSRSMLPPDRETTF
jgi:AhpD family alkylhydroperoxidase